MTTYEFTGKSVKEAIAKACEELHTEESLLDIDVIEESTRGFLGVVGHRDARVRVKRRDIPQEAMEAGDQPTQRGSITEPPLPAQAEAAAEPDLLTEADEEEPAKTLDPALFLDEARTIVEEILRRIPVEVEVESRVENGSVYVDIKGDGSGLLIGKKGQTLDALQYLVSKIVNKNIPLGSKVDVIVDTEQYRLRKRESLREAAIKMSEKAKKTLKPAAFNPMPPQERRIIHMILAEDRDVYTKSYGEGPMRRIIVYPRRGALNKRRRR